MFGFILKMSIALFSACATGIFVELSASNSEEQTKCVSLNN